MAKPIKKSPAAHQDLLSGSKPSLPELAARQASHCLEGNLYSLGGGGGRFGELDTDCCDRGFTWVVWVAGRLDRQPPREYTNQCQDNGNQRDVNETEFGCRPHVEDVTYLKHVYSLNTLHS